MALKLPILSMLFFNSAHVFADVDRVTLNQYCENRKSVVALSVMYYFDKKIYVYEIKNKIKYHLNERNIDKQEQNLLLYDVDYILKEIQSRIEADSSSMDVAYEEPMNFSKIISDVDYRRCLQMIAQIR